MIPLSSLPWSPRRTVSMHDNESMDEHRMSSSSVGRGEKVKKTGFVPKERQLAKLRARIAEEQKTGGRGGGLKIDFKHCSQCDGGLISL